MRNFVAFQFDLQPRPEQRSRDCLAVVREMVNDWIRGLFRGMGVHDLELPFDGSRTQPLKGHELLTQDQEEGIHRLVTWEWEFPQPEAPNILWRFSCILAMDDTMVQAALAIQQRWQSFMVAPLSVGLEALNPLSTVAVLRDQLLDTWNCRIEGHLIPNRVQLLRKFHVDRFFKEAFCSDRVWPVVLFWMDENFRVDETRLQRVQKQLRGLADVAALIETAATVRLRKLLLPRLGFPEHALGIYWPGWVPQEHYLYPTDHVQKMLRAKLGLGHQLQRLLAPVAAEQFREGRIIRAARAAFAEQRAKPPAVNAEATDRQAERNEELERLRQSLVLQKKDGEAAQRHIRALLDGLAELRTELNELRAVRAVQPTSPEERDKEWERELERAWDENKRLAEELKEHRRQVEELETDFRNYLDASLLFTRPDEEAEHAGSPACEAELLSVIGALRQAADRHADRLVIYDDAERSAGESSFANPAKVYRALEAIAEVGEEYYRARDGGAALGPVERAFRQRVPLKYTGFESQTTMSVFGRDRMFSHHSTRRQMQRHLTLGGGTTNNCLQIYFEFDDTTRRVHIGYCGRHLPYSRQRT